MKQTLFILSIVASLVTGSGEIHASESQSDDYRDARARMVTAWQAGDHAAMRRAASDALAARPNHPGARFNLALAAALDGDPASALMELHRIADMQVLFDVADMPQFEALHEGFTWPDLMFKHERMRRARGQADIAATFGPVDFIPEGILRLDEGHFLLGSIRKGSILEYRDGETREISSPESGGHWSVFGMRRDAEGMVWFASAAVEQFGDVIDDNLGRTGLFRIDPASGEIIDELLLPKSDRRQLLGDLVIDADGIIYATDSLGGSVYRYDPTLRALQELVMPGHLDSPQGLVLLDDGRGLVVADYAQGLFVVDTLDGSLRKLANDSGLAVHGIDGLYRSGRRLVAIQNGIQPHRVAMFELDAGRERIIRGNILVSNHPEFVEPTLGQVVGERFYFIANSQWNRFAPDGSLPGDGLRAPVILVTELED